MRSIRDFTDEELRDRIEFIENEEDLLSGEEWDREWSSEYYIAIHELNRRKHDTKLIKK